IKKYAVATVQSIRLTIVNRGVKRKNFGAPIWTPRMKTRLLIIPSWGAMLTTEHLAAGRIIKPNPLDQARCAERLQQANRARRSYVGCVLWRVKGYPHVRECPQMIDFVGCNFVKQPA